MHVNPVYVVGCFQLQQSQTKSIVHTSSTFLSYLGEPQTNQAWLTRDTIGKQGKTGVERGYAIWDQGTHCAVGQPEMS